MSLKTIVANLEHVFNLSIQETHPCFGGDINEAWQLRTKHNTFFLKFNLHASQSMFLAEAEGLRLLAQANVIRIPKVIHVTEKRDEAPAYLLLEWLDSGQTTTSTQLDLGESLARLHLQNASLYGLNHDNFIGRLPQSNSQSSSWVEFYGEQRLRPQLNLAIGNGQASPTLQSNLEKLINKLPNLIPDNIEPSLLHGDLWGGNFMTLSDGRPALIDPAVYYGHREVELAFTELFGGFDSRFYDAYSAVYPIDKDYAKRRALYQLYPLMVHMNLFGGSYTSRVHTIVQHYL